MNIHIQKIHKYTKNVHFSSDHYCHFHAQFLLNYFIEFITRLRALLPYWQHIKLSRKAHCEINKT